jgi:DNA (cytosine-5)-methyltransferase 1
LLTYDFVDLFCGCGGLTQGFLQAGMNPVGSVEIVEVAANTHKLNFPRCKCYNGDIKNFRPDKCFGNKNIHLVIGGPPCQGFSVAGKRDPNDPRNKLFYEFVRIVDELKPWYVVLENVPGILTMKKGKVKDAIIQEFAHIGYNNMSISVLESAKYGVPQFRPRAIFIANRFDLPNYYPNPQLTEREYVPIETAISDLSPDVPNPKINHEWTKHSKEFMKRLSKVPPGGSLYETFLDAFKRQYPGLPSMTIKENHGGTHIHPYLNRCISAREMARLQTFPDSFFFTGTMKKAMWQIGNAVPPLLAENIAKALITGLNRIVKKDFANDKKSFNQGVLI